MGKHGEGWVGLQLLLAGLIILAPPSAAWPLPSWLPYAGVLLMGLGGLLGAAAVLNLGASFTVLPRPVEAGELVQRGLYQVVRHPIYLSLTLVTLGWVLIRTSVLGLLLVALLFVVHDLKSRQEERWLTERYPTYPAYQRRVKRLIPWLY